MALDQELESLYNILIGAVPVPEFIEEHSFSFPGVVGVVARV